MELYPAFHISPKLLEAAQRAEELARPQFAEIESIQRYNQQKMLAAFSKAGVSESHFVGSTGYGYGDRGRDVLDQVYAYAFGAEDALVRHNFVSGTHTLTVALFGMLRPGDKMLCVTGTPYDTIQGVIGMEGREEPGSLKEFGIHYEELPLRPSLRVEDIAPIVEISKRKAPDAIVMVDNCYGEFVEREEPLAVGADIIAGSLIKNPGGGIAPTGGYIAGRRDLVELCSYRLTTPGTGREIGCTLGNNRELFMGAFHAPHVAGEALKTAVFASALFSQLGFGVTPTVEEKRGDIIQVMLLEKPENLIAFCKGVQKGAPVDSFVVPEPSDMPGYDSQVIMAAGAFTLGSSIELSADAPLREPYAAWMQGGLNYHSGQLGMLLAAQEMANESLLNLQ